MRPKSEMYPHLGSCRPNWGLGQLLFKHARPLPDSHNALNNHPEHHQREIHDNKPESLLIAASTTLSVVEGLNLLDNEGWTHNFFSDT